MVEIVLGPTLSNLIPFIKTYRILVTTRLSLEWGGLDQNGSYNDNLRGQISINSKFR